MAKPTPVSIVWDARAAQMRLERAAAGIESYLIMLTGRAAQLVKETEQANAPEGVAGRMGQGIKGNIDIKTDRSGLSAQVGPNESVVPYAQAVEFGSRPHMPPAFKGSALDQWCEMHGLNTWAVAKSIATKGTRPHPYVEPTYAASQTAVPEIFTAGIRSYVERFAL